MIPLVPPLCCQADLMARTVFDDPDVPPCDGRASERHPKGYWLCWPCAESLREIERLVTWMLGQGREDQ